MAVMVAPLALRRLCHSRSLLLSTTFARVVVRCVVSVYDCASRGVIFTTFCEARKNIFGGSVQKNETVPRRRLVLLACG
jgi:hypothetical protein